MEKKKDFILSVLIISILLISPFNFYNPIMEHDKVEQLIEIYDSLGDENSPSGKIIVGNTCYWENDLGHLEVYPHTDTNAITHTQYANATFNFSNDIDLVFRFPIQVKNPDIWLWKNISHNVKIFDYDWETLNYTVYNMTNVSIVTNPDELLFGDIPSTYYRKANFWMYDDGLDEWNYYEEKFVGFDSFEWLNPEQTNVTLTYEEYKIVGYHFEEQYYFDWFSIKDKFSYSYSHGTYNYRVTNIPVLQDQEYRLKWYCETPINTNIKWSLMGKLNSMTIQQALDSEQYIELDPDYHSNFSYRKLLTIDTSQIPSQQSNFPVLIWNDSDTDLKNHVAQADGDDIIFLDYNDNTVKLYHELVDWNSTGNGNIEAWVNMTTLSGASNKLWMYYGNSTCGPQEEVANTWDDNYVFVHHLSGSHYDELKDSASGGTTNNFDGEVNGTGDGPGYNDTNAVVGKCVRFYGDAGDGDALYIEYANQTGLSFGDSVTDTPFVWNFWVNVTSLDAVIVNEISKYGSDPDREYIHRLTSTPYNNNFVYDDFEDNQFSQARTSVFPVGYWFMNTLTYDGRGGSSACDGQWVHQNGTNKTISAKETQSGYDAMKDDSCPFYLGGSALNTYFMLGYMDEIFLSDKIRGDDYNEMLYNTMYNQSGTDSFVDYGDEEETSADVSTNVLPIVPYRQEQVSYVTVNATSTGATPDNVTLWYRHSTDNSSWGGVGAEDYKNPVDSNTSDNDSSEDIGVEENFSYCQNTTNDGTVMTITENNTGGQDEKTYVMGNETNVDGSVDKGTEENFSYAQDVSPDSDVMTIIEENMGGVGGSPSVRSNATSSENSNTDTHTVSLPSTVEKGDTLLVFFVCDDNELTLTWPDEGSTWNVIYEEDAGSSGPIMSVAWKNATGEEGGTTITISTGSTEMSTHMSYAIQGATDPTVDAPEASAEATGQSQYPNSGSLTPSGGTENYLWFSVYGSDDDTKATSYPTFYDDNQYTLESGTANGAVGMGACTREYKGTNQDPGAFTVDDSEEWEAVTVAVYPSGGAPDYEADMEYNWSGLNYSDTNEWLCMYLTGTVDEDLYVDYRTSGDAWSNLGFIDGNGWNNFTLTDKLENSSFYIKVYDEFPNGDSDEDSWTIDVMSIHTWNDTNYEIDFEYNWSTANYSSENEEICIYVESHDGSETLDVNYYDGGWQDLTTITGTGWKNFTATGLNSPSYTIQLKGVTETGDASQDSWDIDVISLHTWNLTSGWQEWVNDDNPDNDSSWQWTFDCPNGTGYYEFYSIGNLSGTPETAPVSADAICHVNHTDNVPPTQSNPSPTDGATNIPITPSLSVTCNDENPGDTLNATWLSNSSGSWLQFESNLSIDISSGAVTITQNNANFTAYNQTYYWSVNLSDGNDTHWVNETYHFTTELGVTVTPGVVATILEFDALTKNNNYKIYYSKTSGVGTSDNETYQDPDDCNKEVRWTRKMIIQTLNESTKYYYRIYDNTSKSWHGSEKSFTTLPRWTTNITDKFFDTFLIDSSNNASIVQQVGTRDSDNPYFLDTEGGTGWYGFATNNNDDTRWDGFFRNYSSTHAGYYTSTDGENWELQETVEEMGLDPTGYHFKENNYNDTAWWTMTRNTSGDNHGDIYVSNTGINGTYTLLAERAVDIADVDGNEIGMHNSGYNDSLRCDVLVATGQIDTAPPTTGHRYLGQGLAFNLTDWLHWDNDYRFRLPVPDGYSGDWHYTVSGYLDNGVYVYYIDYWYQQSPNYNSIETYLYTSRNGINFTLVDSATPIVTIGESEQWDDGMILVRNYEQVADGNYEYLYYNAQDDVHGTGGSSGIGRIQFRKDGLTAIEPTTSNGWFLTDTINSSFVGNFTLNGFFNSTDKLNISVINASTGDAFDNFTFSDFTTITSNSTSIIPSWSGRNLHHIPDNDFKLNFSFDGSEGQLFAYYLDEGIHEEYVPPLTPEIVINFAGNLSDSGGPYWRPPGETDILDEAGEGIFRDGYTTNNSKQTEDWRYINLTVTEGGTITNVWLNWINETVYTNWTYAFVDKTGGYYEYNTSGNIQTASGYNYSFDIFVNSTAGNNYTAWNKTGLGGGLTRRYVQLNHTTTNISYDILYLQNTTYSAPDGNQHDRLQRDQGTMNTITDTGFWGDDIPASTVQNVYCSDIWKAWINTDKCVEDDTLDNVYVHIWGYVDDYTALYPVMFEKTRGLPEGNGDNPQDMLSFDFDVDNKSNISWSGDYYHLFTGLINRNILSDYNFTDNSIYEINIGVESSGKNPGSISNRSFTSFVIPNVDSDIMDGTDNSTDTDGDDLSDHMEINETYGLHTNPFEPDTDNDGINDYWEKQSGSDPNNYTETYNISITSFSTVLSTDPLYFNSTTSENYNVNASGQSAGVCAVNITNDGNVPINISIKLNNTIGNNIYLKYNTTFNPTDYTTTSGSHTNWDMLMFNQSKWGATTTVQEPINNTVLWTTDVGGIYDQYAGAVIHDGIVYFQGKGNGGDNNTYALYLNNGTIIWNNSDTGGTDETPLFYNDMLYVQRNYYNLESPHKLYCTYPSNGTIKWSFPTPVTNINIVDGGSPTASPELDLVYALNAGIVYAVYPNNGTQKWNRTLINLANDTAETPCSPTYFDYNLYIPAQNTTNNYNGGMLVKLNASTGDIVWWRDGADVYRHWDSSPTIAHVDGVDVLYIGTTYGYVQAWNITSGTQYWDWYEGADFFYQIPAYDAETNSIFIGSADNLFWCLNATTDTITHDARERWEYGPIGDPYSSPVIAGDFVYFGGLVGVVFCLWKSNGTKRWEYDMGGDVYSQPAIADGILVVANDDRKIMAFGDLDEYNASLSGYSCDNEVTTTDQQIITDLGVSSSQCLYLWGDFDGATTEGDILRLLNITSSPGTGYTGDNSYNETNLVFNYTSEIAIDAEVYPTIWDEGNVDLNTYYQKNFTFYQNGSSTLDILIGVDPTNFTFVNYTEWLDFGHDRYCANFTTNVWVSEDMIEPGVPGATVLKDDFAPGSFTLGIRIWTPRTVDQSNKQEDYQIILTVSEAT